jgi:hypothetical protein
MDATTGRVATGIKVLLQFLNRGEIWLVEACKEVWNLQG